MNVVAIDRGDSSVGQGAFEVVLCPKCVIWCGDDMEVTEERTDKECEMCPDRIASGK